jgi:hypothetical protein
LLCAIKEICYGATYGIKEKTDELWKAENLGGTSPADRRGERRNVSEKRKKIIGSLADLPLDGDAGLPRSLLSDKVTI